MNKNRHTTSMVRSAMSRRMSRTWTWLTVACAMLVLSAATAQAAPFQVGLGAFSGAPEVTFSGSASNTPYTENGATFFTAGGLPSFGVGTTLGVTPPASAVEVVFASPQIRFGYTADFFPSGGVTSVEFFTDDGFTTLSETHGPLPSAASFSFLGVEAMSPFQSLRLNLFSTFVIDDFRFEAVPEPGSAALTLIPLATLSLIRRHRSRSVQRFSN